jgi:hypothetical protein
MSRQAIVSEHSWDLLVETKLVSVNWAADYSKNNSRRALIKWNALDSLLRL